MRKKIDTKTALGILIIITSIIIGYTVYECKLFNIPISELICCRNLRRHPVVFEKVEGINNFSSEEDFKNYLAEAELSSYGLGFGGGIGAARDFVESALPAAPSGMGEKSIEPERVSETNVQVKGIDEPDIVKTDGKEIYFSSIESYYWDWEMMIAPSKLRGETKAIKAFPPSELDFDGKIDQTGNLVLSDNILIIFSTDKIYGYDISDPKYPKKAWTIDIEKKSSITDARFYNDKIYLITQTTIDGIHPCPVKPLSIEGVALEISCMEIYHPVTPIQTDVTYNALIVDPGSGKIEKNISFVGLSGQSVVYMSQGGIYVTYSYGGDFIKFYSNFFKEKCQDIVPDWLIEKMDKLIEYDISESAKITELNVNFQKYYNSLSDDERMRIDNELANRMADYYKEHKRDLEKTGIIKIDLNDFKIAASGNVPGQPLNQFSLDEYENHLRIAITVGERFFGIGFIGISRQSANDVYVLDKDLKVIGSVKDLGLEERIYSARFIEDKGYLVTFRQIDPFYVLDLSNPENPELKGELKIPGYSSYLHPITKDKILGIGKENSQVKISLFNVENPAKPSETAKYNLNEYWSDVLNTHHAFLLDTKHQIFFLPGGQGGYVFSYQGNQLKLTRAISDIQAKRAVYLDDYLYVIGADKIIVLDEISWEKVNELDF